MKFLALALLACLPSRAAIAIEDVTVIAAIGGAIPQGARIVNGRGKFLIPGLWDMHVHLWSGEAQLARYLAYGVTGVEDMGSDFARVSAWRDAIESGKVSGPHIITSGPAVDDQTSGDSKLPVLIAANPREARQAF